MYRALQPRNVSVRVSQRRPLKGDPTFVGDLTMGSRPTKNP